MNDEVKTSIAKEIINVNDLLRTRVDVEKHNSEDGAVINIGLNRLANLAAHAEKLLKHQLQHPGKMDTSEAPIPESTPTLVDSDGNPRPWQKGDGG